eukprot:6049090-Pleurochrysis_carterae.AAC.1
MIIANALAGRITLNSARATSGSSGGSPPSDLRSDARASDRAPPATATVTNDPSPQLVDTVGTVPA